MPNFAVSPASPRAWTIHLDEGNTRRVIATPKSKLPTRTIEIVERAWLEELAPINCEAMLAPACEKAWIAIKMVPKIGMRAPTPAAALSLVRERNQLSIIG